MNLTQLNAISPIDGRYRNKIDKLANYFSEEALIKYRVRVEIEYFIALCELPLPQLSSFDTSLYSDLRKVYENFTTEDAIKIKDIEKVTNHDVKAVEYFIKANNHTITGSVNVTGSVTATQFTAINGVGTPTLTSANNIILSASNVVQVKDALLRVNSFANTDTGSLTIADGDFYYNVDEHSFFGVISGSHTAFGLAGTGSGITDIVSDTSPQLGGTLDINTYNISGSGSINIDGSITATGDVTAYYSSDERLKDNVTVIGSALDKINQIGGYEFDWNSDSEHSGHDVGVIAQEIEKVLPEVVVDRDTGYKAVRYDKIVALLIQAVKEQQLQIDELKSKL